MEKKKKENFFKRFIKKLGEENSKAFGDEKLDCCKLQEKKGRVKGKEKE